MPKKTLLRLHYMQTRDSLGKHTRQRLDARIIQHLLQSDWYTEALSIFTYLSTRSEVDTYAMVHQAWADKKRILVPRTTDEKGFMEAVELNSMEQLVSGKFQLMEPEDTLPASNPILIDLVIIPGLAFDPMGFRIGYGGGYYDRFLANVPSEVKRVGLGYGLQLSEEPLPRNPHDQPLDALITESGWLFFDR